MRLNNAKLQMANRVQRRIVKSLVLRVVLLQCASSCGDRFGVAADAKG
jgi:hypothetical protein